MINPELRKNFWLELSITRVAIMAVILLILFYLSYSLNLNLPSGPKELFFILVIIWGTKLASQAMNDEFIQNTWDTQRMSSISAWSLTWGKLLGSTAYVWVGGIICLAAFAAFNFKADPRGTILEILQLLGVGLLTQCIAFVTSLQAIQANRSTGRGRTFAYFIIGLLFSTFAFIHPEQGPYSWYGVKISSMETTIITIYFLVFWAYVGAYRLMRIELQHRNGALLWLIFLACYIAYFSGYLSDYQNGSVYQTIANHFNYANAISIGQNINLAQHSPNMNLILFGAFGFTIATCYIMVFFESKSPILWHRILLSFKAKHFGRFFQLVPCWSLSLLVAIGLAIWMIFYNIHQTQADHNTKLFIFSLATILLFLTRDVSVFIALNLSSKKTSRVDLAAAFYILFSYAVLGGLFENFGFHWLSLFFVPLTDPSKLNMQLLFVLVENIALWFWVGYRWRKLKW